MTRTGYNRYQPRKQIPLVPFMEHRDWYDNIQDATVRLNYLMDSLRSVKGTKHEPHIVWCDIMIRGYDSAVTKLESQILAVKKNIKQLKEQTNG